MLVGGLGLQVEEELHLMEQDFLESMFEQLLSEEEEKGNGAQQQEVKPTPKMELPTVRLPVLFQLPSSL